MVCQRARARTLVAALAGLSLIGASACSRPTPASPAGAPEGGGEATAPAYGAPVEPTIAPADTGDQPYPPPTPTIMTPEAYLQPADEPSGAGETPEAGETPAAGEGAAAPAGTEAPAATETSSPG